MRGRIPTGRRSGSLACGLKNSRGRIGCGVAKASCDLNPENGGGLMVSETGVALAVVDPTVGPERLVLVVQEETTNPKHGKVAGQWTVPMETCRAGESDAAALRRLVAEELANMAVWVEAKPFGSYEVMPGIEVRLYLGFVRSSFAPEGLWVHPCGGPLGKFTLPPESAETDGVSGHAWVSLERA